MNENSKAPKSDDLDSLKRLLIQGQFAAALSRAESLSAEFPGDASTLNMLGLALMQTGQNEPALAAFARANAADPLYSAPFLNRANLLVSLGRYDEAKTACVGAFAAGPPPEDAAKAYHLLGVSLANSGNPVGAEAPFRAAIANAPNMPGAHSGLGGVLGVLKRFDEALAVLEPAAAKWTDDNGIARNLGNALIETAQYHAATRVLEAAVLRSERDAGLRMALARALRGAGRYQAALDEAEQAVALVPGSAEAQGLLGTCRQTLGDTSGAIAAYDKVLEGTPDDPTALVSRWRMTPLPPGEPAWDRISALLSGASISADHRIALELVMFQAHDKLGNVDEAFKHVVRSCAARRQGSHYDIEAQARMFEAIKAAFSVPVPPLAIREPARSRPVFIVGMPRSGTSLVEQILASHPEVFGAGELPDLGRAMVEAGWGAGRIGEAPTQAMLAKTRETYLAALGVLGTDRPVVTDKTPMNFRWLGFALAALPEARVLVLRRDARATCFSNLTHHLSGRANDFAADMVHTAEMYRLHLNMVEFWRRLYPDRITMVPYEKLTENQEPESRRLVDAIGLDWDPACLAFHESTRGVRTASTDQVRRPMYTGSSDVWRRYEKHLGPMLQKLEGL